MTKMKEINKEAWNIRRNAAKKIGCKVNDILWGECYRLAKEKIEAPGKVKEILSSLTDDKEPKWDVYGNERIYFDNCQRKGNRVRFFYEDGNFYGIECKNVRMMESLNKIKALLELQKI